MHFNVDVVYLWMGSIIFVGCGAIGLFRGTFEETVVGAVVGIVMLAVGVVGPESQDEMSEEEEQRMFEQYQLAGYYSFLFTSIGGGVVLLWLVWDGRPILTVAAFVAVVQIPYLVTRVYLRRQDREEAEDQ